MSPFYGLTERLILVAMICNVTITGPAPQPLLNNVRCKLETVKIYNCLFIIRLHV